MAWWWCWWCSWPAHRLLTLADPCAALHVTSDRVSELACGEPSLPVAHKHNPRPLPLLSYIYTLLVVRLPLQNAYEHTHNTHKRSR